MMVGEMIIACVKQTVIMSSSIQYIDITFISYYIYYAKWGIVEEYYNNRQFTNAVHNL